MLIRGCFVHVCVCVCVCDSVYHVPSPDHGFAQPEQPQALRVDS